MPHCTCVHITVQHCTLYTRRCTGPGVSRGPHTGQAAPGQGWSDQDTAAAVIHDTDMDFVILKVGWGPFFYWCLYNVLNNVECSEQYKLGKHE